MTVGHRAQKENFLFRDWSPFCVWLEASPLSPRGTLTAGMLLNYRCGSDSSNLPKCCELLPVPVPVRVLSREESTNQMKLTLLSTQMQPWILLFTTLFTTLVLSRDWLYNPWSWMGPCDVPHGFLSKEGGMNNQLFLCLFYGVEERENKVTIK